MKSHKAYYEKDSGFRRGTISPGCAFAMKEIWKEREIQQVVRRGSKYALYDNFVRCFNLGQFRLKELTNDSYIRDVDRFVSPAYLPTDNDILRARLGSTGVTDCHVKFNKKHCRVFDVGGTRVERKKWVHTFEMINYVVFVAPLSGYDQCLVEDKTAVRHSLLPLNY